MANQDSKAALAQTVTPARKRPDNVSPPKHWKADSAPEPEAISPEAKEAHANGPTRYGDWESKGMAIDF
ncbi:DUF1674 domain-containing protein [Alterisphingorhabdus coralli]|uniref:DUF1674 domain-containing protein n=1 Tax=Alterisphingorhabdus coralli TaxID=3071408 RepID=A0AA97F6C1_9SPHN|nr:DUF1674 domain-containing protein [Parasphingorhabdus sp. SCSIO 66989]WOE75174.1 DUF1674 domain-containing protein [Parasphingorhabdus sp. SCSIO 66989]